jgi:hypothetical protein
MGFGVFLRNVTLTGGVAPARAYIEELLPDVLDGTVQPWPMSPCLTRRLIRSG